MSDKFFTLPTHWGVKNIDPLPPDKVWSLTQLEINSILLLRLRYPTGVRACDFGKATYPRDRKVAMEYSLYGGIQLRKMQRKGLVLPTVQKSGTKLYFVTPEAVNQLSYINWNDHDFDIYSGRRVRSRRRNKSNQRHNKSDI